MELGCLLRRLRGVFHCFHSIRAILHRDRLYLWGILGLPDPNGSYPPVVSSSLHHWPLPVQRLRLCPYSDAPVDVEARRALETLTPIIGVFDRSMISYRNPMALKSGRVS